MFSLQKLLGQEDKFFNLLEASAREARTGAEELVKLVASPNATALSDAAVQSRRKEKELRAQISEAISKTFVTALEREDIESLANGLYRITKSVEKFGERYLLSPQQIKGVDFTKQITLLSGATATVVELLSTLRKGGDLEEIRKLDDRMHALEGDADKAILDLLRDLYSGKHDAITVMVRKDLFELLEKVIDRCRDVSNVISNIALKNS